MLRKEGAPRVPATLRDSMPRERSAARSMTLARRAEIAARPRPERAGGRAPARPGGAHRAASPAACSSLTACCGEATAWASVVVADDGTNVVARLGVLAQLLDARAARAEPQRPTPLSVANAELGDGRRRRGCSRGTAPVDVVVDLAR